MTGFKFSFSGQRLREHFRVRVLAVSAQLQRRDDRRRRHVRDGRRR